MVAGAPVVMRIGAGGRALLLAEQRRDGGVDVDEHFVEAAPAQRLGTLLGEQFFERLEFLGAEATKVVV